MNALELAESILDSELPCVKAVRDAFEVLVIEVRRLYAVETELREQVSALEQNIAAVMDGTFAIGDGTAQREIERLRAEVDRMRPVVEAAERWASRPAVHDEVVMDAVRRYKARSHEQR